MPRKKSAVSQVKMGCLECRQKTVFLIKSGFSKEAEDKHSLVLCCCSECGMLCVVENMEVNRLLRKHRKGIPPPI